jgi:hypothetical protein
LRLTSPLIKSSFPQKSNVSLRGLSRVDLSWTALRECAVLGGGVCIMVFFYIMLVCVSMRCDVCNFFLSSYINTISTFHHFLFCFSFS